MREPIEIAPIAIPVLIEIVVVVLFIGMAAVWCALASGGVPA